MSRDLSLAPVPELLLRVSRRRQRMVILAHSASRVPIVRSAARRRRKSTAPIGDALTDLPSHGRAVRIKLSTRRFRCVLATCGRRIFWAAHGDGRPTVCSADDASGKYRASSWAGPGRPSWAEFRRGACCYRSARIRCCASFDVIWRPRPLPPAWSASTTGPSGVAIAMARSSATWSNGASSTCCPTARRQPLPPGLPRARRSA